MIENATLRFSPEKGFGESYFILCPVCWNASIKVFRWEDGSEEVRDCSSCSRMERLMDNGDCSRGV